jgi:hypothetical protein
MLGKVIPIEYNVAILAFSLFPDIDVAFDFVKQLFTKQKYKVPASHHSSPTHWPIAYLPLLALALITMEPFFIIAAACIYVHLFMDTLYCNEGVMLFYPISHKWYNFFAETTKHKKGWAWNKAYGKLRVATVDKYAFLLLVVHSVYFFIL